MKKTGFRIFDFVILTMAAALIAGATVLLKNSSKIDSKLVVVSAPNAEYIFPLDKDGIFYIPGLLGESAIRISEGKAYFEDSPCPTKSCVFMNGICETGEWCACLPNKVFIRIEGTFETGNDLDGISR